MKEYWYYSKKHRCAVGVKANSKKEVVAIAKKDGEIIKTSVVSCPGEKIYPVDLISHYNKRRLRLLVSSDVRNRIHDAEYSYERIGIFNEAFEWVKSSYPSRTLSYSQYLKMKNFFGSCDIDYFDDVEIV